jgi:hypothetical protein
LLYEQNEIKSYSKIEEDTSNDNILVEDSIETYESEEDLDKVGI